MYDGISFALTIALSVGVFFLVRYALIAQLSNVSRADTANAYMIQDSFHLTEQNDTYLYTNVTRTPKARRNVDDD